MTTFLQRDDYLISLFLNSDTAEIPQNIQLLPMLEKYEKENL